MQRPNTTRYLPPQQRVDGKFAMQLRVKTQDYPRYNVSMDELSALQREYEGTFNSGLDFTQAVANRKALKADIRTVWLKMAFQAIDTFHNRTRCPDCKQTPITLTSYLEMNHQLPKAAYVAWKSLCKRMEAQVPEIVSSGDWMEYMGELRFIETWYWEDNVASLGCGRASWNGMLVPSPISFRGDGEKPVVKTPKIFSRMS